MSFEGTPKNLKTQSPSEVWSQTWPLRLRRTFDLHQRVLDERSHAHIVYPSYTHILFAYCILILYTHMLHPCYMPMFYIPIFVFPDMCLPMGPPMKRFQDATLILGIPDPPEIFVEERPLSGFSKWSQKHRRPKQNHLSGPIPIGRNIRMGMSLCRRRLILI